ncbi:MAG: gamma-glutamylcyclotransferase [Sphingomonadales bacterium]|nr:MAG: gamma-glutamylcyclotransferase [Sphingomonadales bacterium]TNF05362.1 MAG: gamma-glutamylcyclotransferase [Sphingomonadales bacterium]
MPHSDTSPYDLLFVYGTLRPGCSHAMAQRLTAESDPLGSARIGGALYRIGDYPGLVLCDRPPDTPPADHGDAWVTGDLVRLRDPAATLRWLDAYEETGPAFPEPWEYRRLLLPVNEIGDKRTTRRRAWVYIYARSVERLERIIGGHWPIA